jgi:uncharacterized protein YkwD
MEQPLDPSDLDRALLAAALFNATNRVRLRHNLPAFQWNAALQHAADLQADASALKRAADHVHILPSLATPDDRVRHVGLSPRMVGENAALLFLFNTPPAHGLSIFQREDRIIYLNGLTGEPVVPHTYATFAASALQVWLDSPSHRATLLHPDFRYVACSARPTKLINGTEMIACVQVFFTPH